MYDPARDIFTASDDASPDQNESKDRSSDQPAENSKRRSASESAGNTHEVEVIQQGEDKRIASDYQSSNAHTSHQNQDPISSPSQRNSMIQSPEHEITATTVRSQKRKKSSLSPEPQSVRGAIRSSPDALREIEQISPQSKGPDAGEDVGPIPKKRKAAPDSGTSSTYDSPVPMTSANLPRFARKKDSDDRMRKKRRSRTPPQDHSQREQPSTSRQAKRSRSRSPARDPPSSKIRDRKTPLRPRSPSPAPLRRSASPSSRSPRKLKRPGGASRLSNAEKDAIRQKQIERDQAQVEAAKVQAAMRGVHDVVRQHYNAVPERGREFRKTDSKIRGLRSFNNWVKSTIIQKFSPNEDFTPGGASKPFREDFEAEGSQERSGLLVLDIGCGKGGDLFKWQQAPQPVELYVGVDPAEISIQQAKDRYRELRDGGGRGGRGRRGGFGGGRKQRVFHGEFFVKDAFGEWLGELPLIRDVGIDGGVGPGGGGMGSRWGGGGFDVVSMMFCMHYAFESEAKARGMLRNVAGSLKKGGRFLGVIPNSDVLTERVSSFHEHGKAALEPQKEEPMATKTNGIHAAADEQDGKEQVEADAEEVPDWGNSIYRVRFPGKTPEDGIFRPPFGWKYSYFMEEAVEEIPEYVVPWEAFRAIAEDYNLELQYRKPFAEIWREEKDDPVLGPLSERMNVRQRDRGPLLVSEEEMEAAGFYHAFCFYKV
ncbi:MAG: mRNA cap guanine-N7 methyltransferase [Sclerophora amabilis]|nr:MAG: mRNA cap guanine-N7 methyltransferase [Sclerophora amabilis]